MTNQEFSNEFDILYNNISSGQAPGLSEYEKSVFLTNAQDNLVLELVTGKNALGESFEKTEELREYLTDIVKTASLSPREDSSTIKISSKSTLFTKPTNLLVIVQESVMFSDSNCSNLNIEVVPVTHDEYSRIIKNPFRKPSKNKVLRLNVGSNLELVSEYEIANYTIRYISMLEPIILEDLPLDEDENPILSIKGISTKTECILNPALHEAILSRAVQLAKATMGIA